MTSNHTPEQVFAKYSAAPQNKHAWDAFKKRFVVVVMPPGYRLDLKTMFENWADAHEEFPWLAPVVLAPATPADMEESDRREEGGEAGARAESPVFPPPVPESDSSDFEEAVRRLDAAFVVEALAPAQLGLDDQQRAAENEALGAMSD